MDPARNHVQLWHTVYRGKAFLPLDLRFASSPVTYTVKLACAEDGAQITVASGGIL
jgi:hypothetical protein